MKGINETFLLFKTKGFKILKSRDCAICFFYDLPFSSPMQVRVDCY